MERTHGPHESCCYCNRGGDLVYWFELIDNWCCLACAELYGAK